MTCSFYFFACVAGLKAFAFALRIRRVAPKQLAGTQMKMTNVLNFLAYFSALQGARNQEQQRSRPGNCCGSIRNAFSLPPLLSSHVLYANKVAELENWPTKAPLGADHSTWPLSGFLVI